jgi:hypothetical protein
VSRVSGVAAAACATTARRWWTSFAIVFVLSVCWSLATPLFASPDEPAHVVRAASVARGQLLGRTPRQSSLRGELEVKVPTIFGSASQVGCLAFQPDVTANCLRFRGSTRLSEVVTTAGRHPPLYYAAVGWPSLPYPSAFGVRAMRILSALLASALLATAVTALSFLPSRRVAALGVAVAVTPMVLFLSGVVNPSGVEIAAAICVWAAGSALVVEAPTVVRPALVTMTGVGACALALTRQLGPLWLGIAGLVLAWIGGSDAVRALLRSRRFLLWGAAAVVCSLAQVGWVVSVGALDASSSQTAGYPNASVGTLVKGSVGRAYVYYRELIGVFGWRDTNPPSLVLFIWTAAIGGTVLLAVLLANRRVVGSIATIALLTFALPVLFEVQSGHTAGYFWQGRYTLPLAVGIPIVAAVASSRSDAASRLATGRLVWVFAVGLGVAQVLAFGQAIRRYAVGAHSYLNFFTGTRWSPPGGASLLCTLFVLGSVAWYGWLFAVSSPVSARQPAEPVSAPA